MANKAISELPQAQNVNNQDLFVLEQSGIAKKLPAETFITEQGIINALAEALDGHGGISSVTLSSVSGRIRTYRITFTDQSATTFQVYDGTSIDRISRTSSSGLDDVYTIFLSDGTTTFFTVHNGADGNVSEAMLNDALKDKAPAVTETTESSAIANFTDGADDMPVVHLTSNIEPVQDLHGYDNPWPAGGGANVLPITASTTTVSDVTFTVNKDESNNIISITTSGTASGAIVFQCSTGQNINGVDKKLTGCPSGGSDSTYYMTARISGAWSSVHDNGSGLALYGTIDTVAIVVASGVNMNGKTFLPMIAANTVTTFAPYSNICPITGWTGCNVTRTGKNLYNREDSEYNVPVYATNGTASSFPDVGVVYVPVLPNTKYSVTLQPNSSKYYYFRWIECDKNKGFVFRASGTYSSYSDSSRVVYFTTRSNTAYLQVAVNQYGVEELQRNDWEIQIEKGDATTYEPYQGNTVTVDWTSEAGTVYGGTIDVATGLLTVTNGYIASYNGETLPSTWISDRDVYSSGTTPTTGAQVVYALATPQTYQLTPQEVKTLLGMNNVWADTGNVSVTYAADTKMFIEKLTMPTEDDLVANQAITSGKYFMIGNSLYLALANIASGAQITIGTNAQRVSLADALNTINS